MRIYDLRRPHDALALTGRMGRRPERRGWNHDGTCRYCRRYVCLGRHTTARAKASESRIERRTARHYLKGQS